MDYSDRMQINVDEPAVKCVDLLLTSAIAHSASDIHLESLHNGLRVRYRIDGILHDRPTIDATLKNHVISRLKVLANIDITEKRVPQDGQFCFVSDRRRVDLRLATFPALHGEKMVVRILDRSKIALQLGNLGMDAVALEQVRTLINHSQGFFLVTGPTGSGKTTTLYAALAELNCPERHIITLEDPVEYDIQGITQGRINSAIGFTFARGIRSLLRQDPDVVMVGEIRDKETAQTAIEAALTGHMVFSTLHTNDAPSAIVRLVDMAIDTFLISASLSGVLAQRLPRVICTACRISYEPTDHEKAQCEALGFVPNQLYRGQGCQLCGDRGYKGRIGIFELMMIDDAVRVLIARRASLEDIRQAARDSGMRTLRDDGLEKVQAGVISLQELVRVIA